MTPAQFQFLRDLLKQYSGLTLGEDKQYLLEARLMPVARAEGLEGLGALVEALQSAGSDTLRARVAHAMTINETFFFRDRTPFENFRDIMVPALLASPHAASRAIRVWCAAASSGQEPYSLAMQFREMEPQLDGWRLEILATDLSEEVLEKARAGVYSQFEVQRGLPIQLLMKYFSQSGSTWRIDDSIRSMVTFRQLNLLDDFTQFGTFDIVFCRNVLLYFDTETKTDVLARLTGRMRPHGFLALGATETTIGISEAFRPVPDARGVYTLDAEKAVAAAAAALTRVAGAQSAAGTAASG